MGAHHAVDAYQGDATQDEGCGNPDGEFQTGRQSAGCERTAVPVGGAHVGGDVAPFLLWCVELLIAERAMSDKIRVQHRARIAVLYVRQSSAYQINHNLESQKLQYAM